MKELMRIEGLKMYFGGRKAIDGFDLSIYEGETLGIIGPNGAGKTTLFNAICGVYTPTAGKVIFEGKEVQGTPAHEMAKKGIARTFQISKPLAGLTIFDNVVAAAGVHAYTGIGSYFHKAKTGEVEDRVEQVIRRVGLESVANKKASDVSLGYLRRRSPSSSCWTNPARASLTSPSTRSPPSSCSSRARARPSCSSSTTCPSP